MKTNALHDIPLIGITAALAIRAELPPADAVLQNYIQVIMRAGGAPVIVPSIEDETTLAAIYARLDAVLLAGGEDVDPERYGAIPHSNLGRVNQARDYTENALVHRALADQKPILGICRGIQMLNVAMGGTLFQHIPDEVDTPIDHDATRPDSDWQMKPHILQLSPDSRIAALLDTIELPVNSLHHQALQQLAPGLEAVGWAEDGVIEAVEGHGPGFILGVQCHPESLAYFSEPRWQHLFRAFVEAARARAQQR